MTRKSFTALVALLIATSVIAPIVGLAGATSLGPPGLEKVPDGNVGPPDRANAGGPPAGAGPPGNVQLPDSVPTHAAAWSVHTSEHSADLNVTVYETVAGTPALAISDNQNHAGRTVALNATTLEETLGERPELAYGLHENGSRWTSEISYSDGYARLEIPHFSTNTVTFEGTISITGSPANDGSQFTYDVNDLDSVSDYTINVTGVDHTEWDNRTLDGANNGASPTLSVGGTTAARGPSGTGTPTVTLSGGAPDVRWSSNQHSETVNAVVTTTNLVVTASGDNTVVATNRDDGSTAWSYTDPTADVMSLATDGTNIYAGTKGGTYTLHAIDASDGTQAWTWDNGRWGTGLTQNSSHVFVGTQYNNVHAIDKSTATESYQVSYSNTVGTLAHFGGAVYAGTGGANLHRFTTIDGVKDWSFTKPTNFITGITEDGTNVYIANGSEIWALDSTGTVQWNNGYSYDPDRLAIAGSDLFVATSNTEGVANIDPSTGSERWFSDSSPHNYIAATGTHYWATSNTEVHKVTYLTQDPSVSVDGTTVASHTGRLRVGETVTESLDLAAGDHSVSVSTTGTVDVDFELEEVTETVDPAVEVNGFTTSHTGTLNDGETVALTADSTWLKEGTNRVNVSVGDGTLSADAPTPQVDLDYSHTAVDNQSVGYDSEAYTERYNVSKTFGADQQSATLTIPFVENIVHIRTLETRSNGSSWQTVANSDYSLEGTELTVDLGTVSAGETIDVRAFGSKVKPTNGTISVVDPTVLGESLSSKIRVESTSGTLKLGVNGTAYSNSLHYTHSESWSNPQSHARVQSTGEQTLVLPNAPAGGEARLSTVDLKVNPSGGMAAVRVASAGEEPKLQVREATSASSIDFVFRNTVSGHSYQLYSLEADTEIDRATAQSPVTLTHDGSEELLVIYDLGTGGGGGFGGGAGPTSSSGTNPILLIGAAVAALLTLYVVSRRMGDDSIQAGAVFVAGSLIVSVLAIQAMAPRVLAEAMGTAIEEAGPLVLLGAVVIFVVWLRQRGNDKTVNLSLGGK